MSKANNVFIASFIYNNDVIFADRENAQFFHFHSGDIIYLEKKHSFGDDTQSLPQTKFLIDRIEHYILKEFVLGLDGKHAWRKLVSMNVYLRDVNE